MNMWYSKFVTSPRGPTLQWRHHRGLRDRNNSSKVPAPSSYQELPLWQKISFSVKATEAVGDWVESQGFLV